MKPSRTLITTGTSSLDNKGGGLDYRNRAIPLHYCSYILSVKDTVLWEFLGEGERHSTGMTNSHILDVTSGSWSMNILILGSFA